jgi:hypothetical protein
MHPNQQGPTPGPERGCEEKDTPTGKAIATARQVYCTNLQSAKGDQASSEKAYDRAVLIYHKKKKLFEWTEHNYRLYRDFDICIDSELTAVTTSLTTNVKSYGAQSLALYTNIKSLVTKIADLKTKIIALGDAAHNLDKYRNDQANAAQWCLLTGKNVDNCRPEGEHHHHHRPEACNDAENIYEELIAVPRKILTPDMNSLVQSTGDVAGIQTFTNTDTLIAQQATCTTAVTALVTQIQTTMKTRRSDLDAVQTDLSTAVLNCTTAGIDKYTKASTCHAAHCTVQFLCCPPCFCVKPCKPGEHEAHLVDCECRICQIGEKIRSTYRGEGELEEDCGCSGRGPIL